MQKKKSGKDKGVKLLNSTSVLFWIQVMCHVNHHQLCLLCNQISNPESILVIIIDLQDSRPENN
jgi:hypothetical protein